MTLSEDLQAADELIARVDQLHSAPQIAQKILSLTRDLDFNMDEVAKCLENDPALAAKILRVVNSSRYGLRHDVSCIRQAATYIGQRSLRLLTLTFGLVDSLTRGPAAKLYSDYWRRALTMATAASQLAALDEDVANHDAYTGGLLADVGMLVFAQFHAEAYTELCETAPHGPELIDRERERFGCGHPTLGARLLQRWELPEPLIDAVADHHGDPATGTGLQIAVRTGDMMADALWTPNSPNIMAVKLLTQREFSLDTDGFIDLALCCQREVTECAIAFNLQLQGSIDCDQLIEEARRQHDEASLETALELDSLIMAFEDRSC
jgi:HD-like signal output (HDOD) protein